MKIFSIFILSAMVCNSCNQPGCSDNSNQILSSSNKTSWAYQDELMRLINKNPSNVSYYFERRAAINGESFIIMNCYGPEFCGELRTKFVPKNIESIKLQNDGRKGAQLIGVGFRTEK